MMWYDTKGRLFGSCSSSYKTPPKRTVVCGLFCILKCMDTTNRLPFCRLAPWQQTHTTKRALKSIRYSVVLYQVPFNRPLNDTTHHVQATTPVWYIYKRSTYIKPTCSFAKQHVPKPSDFRCVQISTRRQAHSTISSQEVYVVYVGVSWRSELRSHDLMMACCRGEELNEL